MPALFAGFGNFVKAICMIVLQEQIWRV